MTFSTCQFSPVFFDVFLFKEVKTVNICVVTDSKMVSQHNGVMVKVTLLGGSRISFISLTPDKSINDVFTEIADKLLKPPLDIDIHIKVITEEDSDLVDLRSSEGQALYEACVASSSIGTKYQLVVSFPQLAQVFTSTEDELALGASASPTSGCSNKSDSGPLIIYNQGRRKATQLSPIIVEPSNYVGLVNQAMTCYLNSLLQALYMTPEFRNALYNWEFDGANETRSIPYQLQKLFLNLQTSTKSAVETTDLTTSFGWQGSDAWHQHDIQELCRVMFDALEQKFKDTKQANLINDLYEGKMLDYVKCLDCGTEKSREDTFLDIPLPIRPFGSTVSYNSVEEALRAFVQPETLDGNNQYFCEKCNKKCNAHKGLKFTKFPYLLTLHLKRFDFDYNTMHRIKLNDKVVFPERLNLNSFVQISQSEVEQAAGICDAETVVKYDDCSTTDSGSADDESCQGADLSSTANGPDDNCADSDEGIDVSSGNNHIENEAKGPYIYELFSIMIHSGSASGGHYYAYIKDFDKNAWFCFNDQSVSPISEDDIRKSYGGAPHRAYYSGTYSSSTNAYMLMYRQIDKDKNCRAIGINEFPPHIQKLLNSMQQKEEEDRLNKKKEDNMVKINVVCIHPTTNEFKELKISTFSHSTFEEITQHAYNRFKLEGLVDLKDCRIVSYNKQHKCINCSFESDDLKLQDAMKHCCNLFYSEWMLEIRQPGTPWNNYKAGGINIRLYPINLKSESIEEPKIVRVDVGETVGELKEELGVLLDVEPSSLTVVLGMYSNEPKYFQDDSEEIQIDPKCFDYKFYVASTVDKDPDVTKRNFSKLKTLVDLFSYVISLEILLPDTDEGILESLSIPSLDLNQNIDKHEPANERGTNSPSLRVSPQPGMAGTCGDGYDQSNSEDSSLSDSDRTLIGDAPADCMALSSNSASPSDQHMVSPSDPCQDTYNYDVLGLPGEDMYWDDTETEAQRDSHHNYYFKVTRILEYNSKTDEPFNRQAKILADKRMSIEMLKRRLELVLRVPSEYFKIFKHYHIEDEWSRLKDTLRSIKDGERLSIKLGRVLRKGEQQCKIFYLKLDNVETSNFLFDHIIAKNQTVESVKKEILQHAKKQNQLDIPYNRCRLREKSWKIPKKVLLDDQRFGNEIPLSTSYSSELYLQELTEPETVTSNNQVVVFLRRYSPAELTLGPFQEAVLDLLTIDDLRTKVSEVSGIPLEHLGIANVKGNFPYDMHILEVHYGLEWNPKYQNLDLWPSIEDGYMFFYRDNREALKELATEERKELLQSENARLGRLSVKSTYFPGKERALKIIVLDSPSKLEDDID